MTAALVVGFDFSVEQGFLRLLGDPAPGSGEDALAELLGRVCHPTPAPIGRVLAGAWRAALTAVADGVPADQARAVLRSLRAG